MRKIFPSLIVFLMLQSCTDEPNLPIVPEIEFNRIEFIPGNSASTPDSLIVHINFKDGDGDLGLTVDQTEEPFHQADYFYDTNGKLLTIRSRSNPQYAHLPPYERPYDCINYTDPKQTIYFPASVVDNTVNVVETVVRNGVTYYGVNDMIYYENNPNHFNIKVDFLIQDVSGNFNVFDWRKEFCNQSFDGRFPPMRDDGKTLDGTLSYAMTSVGLSYLFSLKVMKLRITIKDQQLHESNTVETLPFTL